MTTLSLEEMTAWSNDDIVVQIEQLKPKSLFFRHGFDEDAGFWRVQFERFNEEQGRRVIVWEDTSPDERLSLFNAFGWVWTRQRPTLPKDSPWAPRTHELRRPMVITRPVRSSTAPHPEDLDPEEVQAVYEGVHTSKNRR